MTPAIPLARPGPARPTLACARDTASLDRLSKVPVEALHVAGVRTPEWVFLHVATLESLWQKRSDFVDLLLETLKATAEDRVRSDFRESRLGPKGIKAIVRETLMIGVPTLKLLARAVEGDAARFEEALREALGHHRDFWLRKAVDEPDIQDPDSYLPLGPLAMTALASDRGMTLHVDSDYLPPVLGVVRSGAP